MIYLRSSRCNGELAGAVFVEIVDLPADVDLYVASEHRKCSTGWTLLGAQLLVIVRVVGLLVFR